MQFVNKVYIALDFPTWEATESFLISHQLNGVPVKIGMELFYREGISMVERLKQNGHDIFLDLKLFDIPTTVMKTMRNLAKLEVDMVNVHALGGEEMIKRAKEALSENSVTKLIAVTILTSMDDDIVNRQLRLTGSLEQNVIHLANLAQKSGADGVVCSVQEVPNIKKYCGNEFLTVTPGIRLIDSNHDDQKRVATPYDARKIGADNIVVGRSITLAKQPYEAYKKVLEEWNNGTV